MIAEPVTGRPQHGLRRPANATAGRKAATTPLYDRAARWVPREGIAVADQWIMFAPSYRNRDKVKDDCWLCSAPIYEGEPVVRYTGLWIHEGCFERENLSRSDPPTGDGEETVA